MQIVYRYDLQPRKAQDFLEWLKKNDSVFRDEAPEGWHYIGSWFTVQGLGQHDVESRWELDDYGSLGAGFGSENFQRVLNEFEDYAQVSTQQVALMKSESDIRMV